MVLVKTKCLFPEKVVKMSKLNRGTFFGTPCIMLLTYSYSCGIALDQKIVAISGRSTYDLVRVWDESGVVETLPNLNTGRYGASCGYYLDDDDDSEVIYIKSVK